MKKRLIIIAAILLVFATIVVSCKKEDNPADNPRENNSKSFYQPPKVDDMNAYLKDFKQKMQTRGNDETMDIEEAAWHLSSVANYDFGDVVNDYAKFRYDTLYYHINVDNSSVSISDMSSIYSRIANDIDSYFQKLNLENKHIRYIGADISDDGLVVMSIMVSYDWFDHQWYFPDPFTMDSILSQYYSEDSTYTLYGNFEDELKRVLDILTGHVPNPLNSYFVYDRTASMMYYDYYDPYSSMNYYSSRVFATLGHDENMTLDEMYYYTDSYAGLGTSLLGNEELIIDWSFSGILHSPAHGYYNTYHIPSIKIGRIFTSNPDIPGDE